MHSMSQAYELPEQMGRGPDNPDNQDGGFCPEFRTEASVLIVRVVRAPPHLLG